MIAPLRLGVATAAQPNGPVIETQRLKLRQWRMADVAPYTAMLADPGTARFITVDGKSVADAMTGWRHTVVMAGHWALHGAGMFAVEERSSARTSPPKALRGGSELRSSTRSSCSAMPRMSG